MRCICKGQEWSVVTSATEILRKGVSRAVNLFLIEFSQLPAISQLSVSKTR